MVTSMESTGFECTAKLFLAVAAVTVRSAAVQKPLPAAGEVEAGVVTGAEDGVVGLGVVVDTPMEAESRGWAEVAGAEVAALVVVLAVVRELGWSPPPLSAARSSKMITTRGRPTKTSRRRQ